MSFAQLKKSSQSSMKTLAEKLSQEKSGGNFGPDPRFWIPEIDKAGNGYAVIRFLPAPEGHDLPYTKVYSHGFKNDAGRWFIENCPTTIGENCPCCDANNVLWETGDKEKQEIVRKRKRQLHYITNILVISDPKHPENEGKVFLWKFGKKIFEKITQAIEPEFEDEKAINPFDFWGGANFKLKIRNFEGFRNYDKSEFEDASELFDGADDALEKLWKSEYSLKEFTDKTAFKSYDVLKAKFDQVTLGIAASAAQEARNEDAEDQRAASAASAQTPARAYTSAVDDDDDDMAAYSKLLQD